jgi:hypothetical protein
MPDPEFSVLCRAVPDGVTIHEAGKFSYRLSVVFLPGATKGKNDVDFKLEDWPQQIYQAAKKESALRIFIARYSDDVTRAKANPISIDPAKVSVWSGQDLVLRRWKEIMLEMPERPAYADLAPITARRALGRALAGDMMKPLLAWPVIGYDTMALANFAKATRVAELILQLAAASQDRSGTGATGNVLNPSLFRPLQRRLQTELEGTFVTMNAASYTAFFTGDSEQYRPSFNKETQIHRFWEGLRGGVGNTLGYRARNRVDRRDVPLPHSEWNPSVHRLLHPAFLAALEDGLRNAAQRKRKIETALSQAREAEITYLQANKSEQANARKTLIDSRKAVKEARADGIDSAVNLQSCVEILLADAVTGPATGIAPELRQAHALYRASMSADPAPANIATAKALVAAQADDAAAAIARKLQGLFAYPSLAKLFGLIVDIELDPNQIAEAEKSANAVGAGGSSYGYIAVDLGSSSQMLWTSYKRLAAPLLGGPRADGPASPDVTPRHPFLPCTQEEIDAVALGSLDPNSINGFSQFLGLQNLRETLGSTGERRFFLENVNVHAATNDRENANQNESNRRAGGEIDGRSSFGYGDLRTSGISLVDRRRAGDSQDGVFRRFQPTSPYVDGTGVSHQFLDAEDLTVGQRVDVRIESTGKWFGLNERITTFPTLLPRPPVDDDYFPLRDRGHIRAVNRLMKVSPPKARYVGTVKGLTNKLPFAVGNGHTITVDDGSGGTQATLTSTGSIVVQQILDSANTAAQQSNYLRVKAALTNAGEIEFTATSTNAIVIGGTATTTELAQFGLKNGAFGSTAEYNGTVPTRGPAPGDLKIAIGDGNSNVTLSKTRGASISGQEIVDAVNNGSMQVVAGLNSDGSIHLKALSTNPIVIGGSGDLESLGLAIGTITNSGTNALAASDTIATWSNWSLSVPFGDNDPTPVDDRQEGFDLAIGVDYDLPDIDDPRRDYVRMPPLRYGREYKLGMRPVFLNGSSLWSTEAHALYEKYSHVVLGAPPADKDATQDLAYLFTRQEPVAKPDVHLAAGLEIIPGVEAPNRDQRLGESIMRMVIRTRATGAVFGAKTSRWIVPPRVAFEMAELEGVFDAYARQGKQMPLGAFRNFVLCPSTGNFPPSINGRWQPDLCSQPLPRNIAGPAPQQHSAADTIALFRKNPGPGQPNPPPLPSVPDLQYYPDPRAVYLRVAIYKNGAMHPDLIKSKKRPLRLPLYAGREWPNALPVRIDLMRLGSDDEKNGIRCKISEPELRTGPGAGDKFWLVTVMLAQAEEVQLVSWCADGFEAGRSLKENVALRTHAAVRDLAQVLGLPLEERGDAPPKVAKIPERFLDLRKSFSKTINPDAAISVNSLKIDELANRLTDLPLAALARHLSLDLVHAAEPPLIRPKPDNANPLGIVRSVANDDNAWRDYVRQRTGSPSSWPSEPKATKAFFFGGVLLDRLSSSEIAATGSWDVFDDDKVIVKEDDVWRFVNVRAQLNLFGPIDVGEVNDRPADLLRTDDGTVRGTRYDFGDTKARTLKLAPRAFSRFKQNFPLPKPGDQDLAFTESEVPIEIKIPSTDRPQPPKIDRILPAFVWEHIPEWTENHKRFVAIVRRSRVRLFLERPWHGSGENELLGVVCWPPYLFGFDGPIEPACFSDKPSVLPIDEIANVRQYGGVEPWVTRWGADPTKVSEGRLSNWIPADRLKGWAKTGRMLDLPLPDSSDAASPAQSSSRPTCFGKVAVAGFAPTFDGVENRWICDIELEGNGYFPFVRFGLVRWQPLSIPGFELSTPVAEWIQTPPRREIIARVSQDGAVKVTASGAGYYQSRTQASGQTTIVVNGRELDRADRPIMIFRLMELRGQLPNDSADTLNEALAVPVAEFGQDEWEVWANTTETGVSWSIDFKLPAQRRGRRFIVFLEEYELMAADSVIGLARRGPTFVGKIILPAES